jgi:PQQ-dependent catabolism-associated CXXCW motif protein
MPTQQPGGDGPAPGVLGAPGAPGAAERPAPDRTGKLDQLAQMERQDFGVPPTQQLHAGPMHGPTPATIPGGQVLTTKGLVDLPSRQVPYLLFDVLGGPETLPNAAQAAWLAEPGTFDDRVQQQLVRSLQQATSGRKDVVLVFYCQSNQCWMSYNAALRAIAAGYTNVLWYRGGIEAWKAAGLPTQPGYRSP